MRTKRWLEARMTSRMKQADPIEQRKTIAAATRMVRAAVRYSFAGASCLEQSLVLWHVLERSGVPSELRVGVRKANGRFEAHAWVEHEGAALNEPEGAHKHFSAFPDALTNLPPEKP